LHADNSREAVVGTVGSTNYADTDQVMTVEVSDASTSWVMAGPVARQSSYQNFYSADLDYANNRLVIYWGTNGTLWDFDNYQISSLTPLQAETYYNIRFRVVGDTLKAKYWATGTTEPSSWQVETTDSSYTTGKPGVLMVNDDGYPGNVSNVDYYADNFQVKNCAVDTCSATSAF
jgi:hypothetical protein